VIAPSWLSFPGPGGRPAKRGRVALPACYKMAAFHRAVRFNLKIPKRSCFRKAQSGPAPHPPGMFENGVASKIRPRPSTPEAARRQAPRFTFLPGWPRCPAGDLAGRLLPAEPLSLRLRPIVLRFWRSHPVSFGRLAGGRRCSCLLGLFDRVLAVPLAAAAAGPALLGRDCALRSAFTYLIART